ncbi:MAG: caspase family protein [Promethearchaeota archaeon]|jgi:hypothetical protein
MKNSFLVILFIMLSLSNTGAQPSKKLDVRLMGYETADLHIISIGINEYYPYPLMHCVSDAKKVTEFFTRQFDVDSTIIFEDSTNLVFGQVFSYTLLNRQATYSSIDSIFQIVSVTAKPEDFLVFYFSGFSTDLRHEDNIFHGIDFLPYVKDSSDIYFNKKNDAKTISLVKLKSWLELIPANKQLIITEAGPSENFFKEFATTLIEKDRIIARLTEKNRVILTTNGIGLDNGRCQNDNYTGGGPLTNFLTNLSPKVNIFQLFDDNFKERVKYYIIKNEIECEIDAVGTSNSLYSAIYFEKDILEIIEEVGKSFLRTRGTQLLNENIKPESVSPDSIKNYALIIGTDEYNEPMWPKLNNPVYDATTIAEKLKEIYSFETELLINPTRNEILDALINYSSIRFDSRSQLFIFIAGHGKYDHLVKGIIATKTSKNPEVDRFHDTYISHSKLRDIIDGFNCEHILVVLDVCFGGTFNKNLSSIIISEGIMDIYAENNRDDYQSLQVTKSEFIKRKMGEKTRLYMTSGGKEYVPDGIPGRHSPFASKFINALDSKGGDDNILTYGEIKSFVEKLSPWPRGGTFGSKSDGDFLFIAKKN